MHRDDLHRRAHTAWTFATAFSVAATLTIATWAPPAAACGGFFCSAAQPVVQNSERIIFVHNDDGTVTALIQIQYQGPSERFAWVLPMPGVPDVAVSSTQAFNRLEGRTDPTYTLRTEVRGICAQNMSSGGADRVAMAGPPAENANFDVSADAPGQEPVSVEAAGSVGPYDYEIISVNDELEDPAAVAVEWLEDNGYDVGAIGPDVLRPYLEKGLNLVAFRLTKTSTAGDIRPVALTFEGDMPMIPIQPTAVAANPNMGVLVFVVGEHRAVPLTYRELVLNQAAVNWFNPTVGYDALIDRAADEAGGHGFVNEYTDSSSNVAKVVFTSFDQEAWDTFRTADYADARAGAVLADASRFTSWDGFSDALRESFSDPADPAITRISNCPQCIAVTEDFPGFDAAAFQAALETHVVGPMRATEELLTSRPVFTRLYTSMSPEEMTEDPVFGFNPDLPMVSNRHQATRVVQCDLTTTEGAAPWSVALPQGTTVKSSGGGFWPTMPANFPANFQILQHGTSGAPELMTDNSQLIHEGLAQLGSGAAGCAHLTTSSKGTPWLGAGLSVVLGLAFVRRRRR